MPDPVTTGENVTDVNTDLLREVAQSGFEKAKKVAAELQLMKDAMVGSLGTPLYWEGEAARLYREVFSTEMALFEQAFASYRAYANELWEYANIYEGVDKQAVSLAADIDEGMWADV